MKQQGLQRGQRTVMLVTALIAFHAEGVLGRFGLPRTDLRVFDLLARLLELNKTMAVSGQWDGFECDVCKNARRTRRPDHSNVFELVTSSCRAQAAQQNPRWLNGRANCYQKLSIMTKHSTCMVSRHVRWTTPEGLGDGRIRGPNSSSHPFSFILTALP